MTLRARISIFFACAVVTLACKRAPAPVVHVSEPPSVSASATASVSPASSTSPSSSAVITLEDDAGAFLGRVPAHAMSYEGAWWLDRAGRDAEQQPEHVLDVIGMHAGQTVADIGCGSGYFSVRMAKRVGPTGRVLATDLQPEMLALLAKKVDAAKLTNVTPILATADDANLPPHAIDIVLFVDVYHEITHPLVTMKQVRDSLREGGKVVLVEYRAEDPKVDIRPEHKMTLAQIKKELAAEGFTFVSSDESLPKQRIVTFVPAS